MEFKSIHNLLKIYMDKHNKTALKDEYMSLVKTWSALPATDRSNLLKDVMEALKITSDNERRVHIIMTTIAAYLMEQQR